MQSPQPQVGDAYVASSIPNPDSRWASRITCIEVGEKGAKFQREHPYHNGETFFLSLQALENSLWVRAEFVPHYEI